jgi:hypothetical protein
VECQRQNLQHHLLPISQCRARSLPALLIDAKKPITQFAKRFAVDSFIIIQGYRGGFGGQFGSGGTICSILIVSMIDKT